MVVDGRYRWQSTGPKESSSSPFPTCPLFLELWSATARKAKPSYLWENPHTAAGSHLFFRYCCKEEQTAHEKASAMAGGIWILRGTVSKKVKYSVATQ